jgi:hypothetical protein
MAGISNKEYSWRNFNVFYLGRIITGIRGLEYKEDVEKEPIYGAGSKPYAIQWGNYSIDGTLTLLQSELEALITFAKANGFGSITEIEFDIVATYAADGKIVKDTIKNVSITSVPKAMKQNDKMMEVALPFIATEIEYQK